MNVDNLLVNYIGEIGRFQIFLLLFGCSFTINNTFNTVEYVFTAAAPNFRCDIGQVTSNLQNLSFDNLLALSSPKNKDGKADACWIRDLNYSNLTTDEARDIIKDGNLTVSTLKCVQWVYSDEEFTETLVSQVSPEYVLTLQNIAKYST